MADMAQYDDTVEAWDRSTRARAPRAGLERAHHPHHLRELVRRDQGVRRRARRRVLHQLQRDAGLRWAMRGRRRSPRPGEDIKVLFLPDQHLGRNTAAAVRDRRRHARVRSTTRGSRRKGEPLGGATPEQILEGRGHPLGRALLGAQALPPRALRPDPRASAASPSASPVKILVHPECCKEVVDKADLNGSTEFIIKTIREAAPGSRWAVGTEVHLVGTRIAREAAARGVRCASSPIASACARRCTGSTAAPAVGARSRS
jgi:quinolinate synthase